MVGSLFFAAIGRRGDESGDDSRAMDVRAVAAVVFAEVVKLATVARDVEVARIVGEALVRLLGLPARAIAHDGSGEP